MSGSLGLIGAFLASLLVGAAAVVAVPRFRRPEAVAPAPQAEGEGTSFLFCDGLLAHATPAALRLLSDLPPGRGSSDLDDLVSGLERLFPGLAAKTKGVRAPGRCRVAGRDGDVGLDLESWGDMTRLTISRGDMVPVHPVTLDLMEQDAALLGLVAEAAPLMIWCTDAEGRVCWANHRYLELVDACAGPGDDSACWPPPSLFPVDSTAEPAGRVEIRARDGTRHWFDLQARDTPAGRLFTASDANDLVASDQLAASFVQTLSKTFAELAVGLAIFDRGRRLVMFNPALTDLSGLPTDFLAGRPSIRSFFDALRARDRLPEPKDYGSWRAQVAALEAGAEIGNYTETWTLTGGETFRVTGRPHPDGAIAFLFEDISAEVALARQHRAEVATRTAALDLVRDAVAVFSGGGRLRISNAGYADDWGRSADGLDDIRLVDEVEGWRAACAPSPVWDRLAGGVPGPDLHSPHPLRRLDGRSAELRVSRLPGGDLAVCFRFGGADKAESAPQGGDRGGRPRAAAG
ncbi:PAS-domain containing protein [Wenxinia marina]|uniref:PAS fold protein n=1 Tax=Wenxinia marina DSM 24838 TaxID=1123501 RepID=A0A0D0Q9I2_9RHOB|nr:PAS-domain containing protein [Wenxinia marina]KIQ71084.1 PAS fold protein [Wenxinia marina DSM 24838]GGL54983.1 diguanylate cyclase [Wenxinia marina]